MAQTAQPTAAKATVSTPSDREIRKATVSTPSDREIRIERIFAAPRERVWRALTDPALVAQWWGRGNQLVVERMEVQRGGHWRFVEHAPDGVHGFEGRYREVTPPERVVQTFEWDGMPGHVVLETMTLEDLGDGRTKLVTVSLFLTTEDRDGMLHSGMEGGLNQSYEALDRVLAALLSVCARAGERAKRLDPRRPPDRLPGPNPARPARSSRRTAPTRQPPRGPALALG